MLWNVLFKVEFSMFTTRAHGKRSLGYFYFRLSYEKETQLLRHSIVFELSPFTKHTDMFF